MVSTSRSPQRYPVCTHVDTAQTVRILQGIGTCSAFGAVGTDQLVTETGWKRHHVLNVLRNVRLRGLVTGQVCDRMTVEMENVTVTWGGHALLRSLT